MDMERFTTLAQQAITQALSIATSFKHAELAPLHILCALIEDASGTTRSLIKRGGGDPLRVTELATAQLHKMPTVTGAQPQTSQVVMQILNDSLETAKTMGDSHATVEHLLLTLSKVKSDAKDAIELGGVTSSDIEQAIKMIRKDSGVTNVNNL